MDFFLLVPTLYMYQLLRSFASCCVVASFISSRERFSLLRQSIYYSFKGTSPKNDYALKFHYSFTYT